MVVLLFVSTGIGHDVDVGAGGDCLDVGPGSFYHGF